MTGLTRVQTYFGQTWNGLKHHTPQPRIALQTIMQAFHKIFPVVAATIVGAIIGGAINWVFLSFTFDVRIQANADEINDLMVIADGLDERVIYLETDLMREIAERLAGIETAITFLSREGG